MNNKNYQVKALIGDVISCRIELQSEYALREANLEKLEEWQSRIDMAWKKLIKAENLLKDYFGI